MAHYTRGDIVRLVEEEDVAFIRLQFSDLYGTPKNLAITANELERALEGRCSIESSVAGFGSETEHKLYLHPDPDTFCILPWRPQAGKVARIFCNIYTGDGSLFAGDVRSVLSRVLARAREKGLCFAIRPQMEFFLFPTDDDGRPSLAVRESAGGYDVAPQDLGENVRRDIILNLEAMGCAVQSSHHEAAPAQHGIDFAPTPAAEAADNIITYRMAVKTIAKKYGLYATFLPKPMSEEHGSGMHLGLFCHDLEGNNLFVKQNPESEDHDARLTLLAMQFIAGVLRHIRGMTLLTNPTVNSYRRLVPGFNAPTSVFCSDNRTNHSAVMYVPKYRAELPMLELNSPDGTCNPYLAAACAIAAGLDGIETDAEPAVIVHDETAGREDLSFENLPETLGEAIVQTKADPLIRETLGDFIYKGILSGKRREWQEYRGVVTSWELEKYLGKY